MIITFSPEEEKLIFALANDLSGLDGKYDPPTAEDIKSRLTNVYEANINDDIAWLEEMYIEDMEV